MKIKSLLLAMCVGCILAGSSSAQDAGVLQAKAVNLNLAQDPGWRALLHEHTNVWGIRRSGVDDPDFFLSPRGMTDSEAELNATIEALVAVSTSPDMSAVCRYPARARWLQDKLGVTFPPHASACERYQSWRSKLAPKGITLVFASYYFNNPASMYGHTFLKLAREGYEPGKGLLDYTVNYAAQTNTASGMMFALKGLTGGYRGRFSTDPYYIKIQKYNNLESRDLWEYDLNLTPEELDLLIAHLWELGPDSISYFFFNKNCSYQLLPLLEAAKPELKLSRRFRYRTIPLDTIRAVLSVPGFAAEPRFRPSHVRMLEARRSLLSGAEKKTAQRMAEGSVIQMETELDPVDSSRRALVLDSAFDLFRYRTGFLRNQPKPVQIREEKLLSLRKDAGVSPDIAVPEPPRPDTAHGTGRIALTSGADRDQGFTEVGLRASLHDQESDSIGFVPGSELEMVHVQGRFYHDESKLRLEKLTAVNVFSLVPVDPWIHPPSWRVWAGLDVARDITADARRGLQGGVKGGSGVTVGFLDSKKALAYVFWRSEALTGSAFRDGYRIGVGGQAGVLIPFHRRARIHLSSDALRFGAGHIGNTVRSRGVASVSVTKSVELRVIGERQDHQREAHAGLFIYW